MNHMIKNDFQFPSQIILIMFGPALIEIFSETVAGILKWLRSQHDFPRSQLYKRQNAHSCTGKEVIG